MCGKRETTAPIPSAATGGEQSSMYKCSMSIANKNTENKYRGIENYGVTEELSGTLASVTGINCFAETACEQMINTKRRFATRGTNMAFHGYQSFAPGEVTPELAHEIGLRFAREMWGDRYEILVATHLNTNSYHNHFVD